MLSFLPVRLPQTTEQFDAFFNSLSDDFKLPNDVQCKSAVASIIMHLGPTNVLKSRYFFAASIYKRLSNEAAYQTIEALRKAENERIQNEAIQGATQAVDEKTGG